MNGRVLIIAGSDSGGGAGIQADIKTVTALRGFAMTAITALTAQNTTGVQGIHEVPANFVSQQMHSVIDDLGADAVKIGMLHSPEIIEAVANVLADHLPDVPVVLDPVMIATSGARLIEDAAVEALVERLLPCADLLIPNAPEAAALSGRIVETIDDAVAAARSMRDMGARAVLMKGGHLGGDTVTDLLFQGDDQSMHPHTVFLRAQHPPALALGRVARLVATHLGRLRRARVVQELDGDTRHVEGGCSSSTNDA